MLPPILNNFQLRFTKLSCCTRRQIRDAATRKADARSDVIISLSSPKRAGTAHRDALRKLACRDITILICPSLCHSHVESRCVTRYGRYVLISKLCEISTWVSAVKWLLDFRQRHAYTGRRIYTLEDAGLSSSLSLSRAGAELPRLLAWNLKSNSRTPRKFLPEINPPITSFPRSLHVKREIKILLSSCARMCLLTCEMVTKVAPREKFRKAFTGLKIGKWRLSRTF